MVGRIVIAVLLAIGFGSAGLGVVRHHGLPAHDPQPVYAEPPSGGHCRAAVNPSTPAYAPDQQPWVDADPTGGVVVWQPGMNVRPCHPITTSLDQQHARLFAQAVRSAKPFPPGIYHCPADDASRADVYLTYPGQPDEVITVGLAGCGGITAPQRHRYNAGWAPALRPFPHHLHDLGLR